VAVPRLGAPDDAAAIGGTRQASLCVGALEEALARFGKPEIFNTDQGSQFTSAAFTGMLAAGGVGGWTTSSSSGCGVRSAGIQQLGQIARRRQAI
jgi:transposase InsO family protein